eukprot:Skav223482  [mRNA]  locus=scaffold643:15800:17638:+ [translate_table: standard]
MAGKRAQWFKKWLHDLSVLRQDEDKLKASMPSHMSKILGTKRLLLWKTMLADLQYHDIGVVDEVIRGVELTGDVPTTGIFESSFKGAEITVDSLKTRSSADRLAAYHSSRSSGDHEIDSTVFEKTSEEVRNGWAIGPIAFENLPQCAVVSRRFGLRQSAKVRLIDDMSGSGINQTVQASESPKPHGTDVVAAMILEVLRRKPTTKVLGRTFDMKAAYKQLAIADSSLWASFVAIFNPIIRKPEVYQLLAAPFGATRSVYSFLRTAGSIWFIGVAALSIVWSCFFDDYVTLCAGGLESNTESTVLMLFKLLGWVIAEDGSKACDFASTMSALGICIDFSKSLDGLVLFTNTEKRVCELVSTIQQFLCKGSMSVLESQRLRGRIRMQLADGQLFGRVGSLCMRALTKHAFDDGAGKMSEQCVRALDRFANNLRIAAPRIIRTEAAETWYIFTDACFEPKDGCPFSGIGGVLVNPQGRVVSFFSEQLSKRHLEILGWGEKKTVIFEAELLGMIVAMTLWEKVIRGALVVCYIDNNSARDVAISGAARNSAAHNLLEKLIAVEMSSNGFFWYARVPSPSNIADEPSRLDCKKMLALKAKRCAGLGLVDSILAETLG